MMSRSTERTHHARLEPALLRRRQTVQTIQLRFSWWENEFSRDASATVFLFRGDSTKTFQSAPIPKRSGEDWLSARSIHRLHMVSSRVDLRCRLEASGQSSCDAEAPPASSFRKRVTGIPPCDPQLIPTASQNRSDHLTRSVRRASDLVLVGYSDVGRKRVREATRDVLEVDFRSGLASGWRFEFWWTRWDSNPRPPHCERGQF